MKKFLVIFVIIFLNLRAINAHPGKLDEDGCHVCRTNCEKWGLEEGEYHCKDDAKIEENINNEVLNKLVLSGLLIKKHFHIARNMYLWNIKGVLNSLK